MYDIKNSRFKTAQRESEYIQQNGVHIERREYNKKDRFRSLFLENGAGDGNRTHATSLEGWSSTIELHPQKQSG